MNPRRSFLTARWCNLILANYAIPEELLRPLVPPGCVLDRRDGHCWGSLVGFQFLDTKVLGIGWPGFRHFPEWNLRFYVTHNGQRGVCFVREFVPSWLIATTARVIYNEPYRSARMTMDVQDSPETLTATYTVKWGGRVHSLIATGAKPVMRPAEDSTEHWFKEHSWGFGMSRRGKLIRYEVNHPEWDVYPVREFTANVDWATLYGPEWGVMQKAEPASVVLAVGSGVSVYPKG
ncbi:MAG: DUF2071 domain-containing protein [Planctomycetaceae bacterium]|nr:DUF2071 domain-containing protein [Planctomycetaceae bacterium]